MFDNWFKSSKPQQRSGEDLLEIYKQTIDYNSISEEQIASVFACRQVIACTIAGLPIHLTSNDRLKQKLTDEPLYKVLHSKPSTTIDKYTFWQAVVDRMLTKGEAFVRIAKTVFDPIVGLDLLQNPTVVIKDGIYYFDGKPKARDSFFHFRYYVGNDPYKGLSPIRYCQQSTDISLNTDTLMNDYYKKSGVLKGWFEYPTSTVPSEQHKTELVKAAKDRGSMFVIDNGGVFHQLEMTATEHQFLESKKFNAKEICSIYKVPPVFLGIYDDATLANINQAVQIFKAHCILPLVQTLENEISFVLDLDEKNQRVNFNLSSLMRSDDLQRWQTNKTKIECGVSVNQIMEIEDLPDIGEAGNRHWLPTNNLSDIEKDNTNESIDET